MTIDRPMEQIRVDIFNAFIGYPREVQKDVMKYVNMIIETGAIKLKGEIDQGYIDAVEARLGLHNRELKESFRNAIIRTYGNNPDYDFMDNRELVKAVVDVRFKSEIASMRIDVLVSRTDKDNRRVYNRVIEGLVKIGYTKEQAQGAVMRYCSQDAWNRWNK